MAVTVIREGDRIRLLEGGDSLPAGQPIRLFTAAEVQAGGAELEAWLDLQMPAFLRGDEQESAEDLF
jgi:hypothetical protein